MRFRVGAGGAGGMTGAGGVGGTTGGGGGSSGNMGPSPAGAGSPGNKAGIGSSFLVVEVDEGSFFVGVGGMDGWTDGSCVAGVLGSVLGGRSGVRGAAWSPSSSLSLSSDPSSGWSWGGGGGAMGA